MWDKPSQQKRKTKGYCVWFTACNGEDNDEKNKFKSLSHAL